ncbi:MAG TPA: alpha/beta hydrolase [Acidimicrobiales bacterium]|nr:alpha/beta hydrolase [Acidimicrobiales bacterium]
MGSFDVLGPLLADHVRPVAYDQRGHGWSESGPVSVRAFADDLAAVVSALRLSNPVLYGGSFGTLVCLGYFLEGGEARGFISEDGRVADFQKLASPPPPPARDRRVMSAEEWNTVRQTFAAAGPTGSATAERSRLLLPDGDIEARPSAEHLYGKEKVFTGFSITDAFRAAPERKLLLAAEKAPNSVRRRSDIAALQTATSLDVHWFDTGHWISAEDTVGVADVVAGFVRQF